ncbi:alpha/beta fold hydrolase [Limimonas halophila]|nr:alpha/beta fold hydrolase [Limimonas halophila]
MYELADAMRRAQAAMLDAAGDRPAGHPYRVAASGERWRLRAYGQGAGPPVLIVAAPIKRPDIWDLTPTRSVVGACLRGGLDVHLLAWAAPAPRDSGATLAAYADAGIGEAVAAVRRATGGRAPVLMGHSLGGTLAAIFAAAHADRLAGLVLLDAPLCFAPGSSRFRDALVAMAPRHPDSDGIVPGSLLSHLSALAAPETFVWARALDGLLHPEAHDLHTRIERWALAEVALPAPLLGEMLTALYREDRFCRGTLDLGGPTVGPAALRCPAFVVGNAADAVAPPQAIDPFVARMPGAQVRRIEIPGEPGVSLQHLVPLLGERAHAELWPEITAWIAARG